MSRKIGVDLGTTYTRIYRKGRGCVVEEATVVTLDTETGDLIAYGNESLKTMGREPENAETVRPVRKGTVAEYDAGAALLSQLFEKACGKGVFNRPSVLISVPHSITDVERLAVEKICGECGAINVGLVETPIIAALGAALPVEDPRGNTVVDIGGGTTEAAVISLGGVVSSSSVRVGGDDFNEEISAFLKRKYNFIVSPSTSEEIKLRIGSVHKSVDKGTMEISGKDSVSGLPLELTLSSEDLMPAFDEKIGAICDCIKGVLEKIGPELCADVKTYGVTLTGGSSALGGLCERLEDEIGVSFHIADEPEKCCVNGLGKLLEIDPDLKLTSNG